MNTEVPAEENISELEVKMMSIRDCEWLVSQILVFQCSREFLTYNTEFNACHDKSIRSFLTCSVCLLMVGSECVWGALERVQSLEGLKIEF